MVTSLRIRRRALLGATAAVPAAGLFAACTGEDGPAEATGPPDEIVYVTNFGTLGRDAYAYVALRKGYFAGAHLDVTIEPGTGTNGNVKALLAGQAQFAAVDFAGAIIANGQLEQHRKEIEDEGLTVQEDSFRALAAVQQQPLAAVMALAESGIRHPSDLRNRTAGMPAGAITELLFDTYLSLAPLVEPDQVTVVTLDPAQLAPALASGQVDAIGQFTVGVPLIQAAADGQDVTVLPYSEFIDDLYGVTLFTTGRLVKQDPDLCVRFRDALLAGLEDALANPEEAGQILAESIPETNPEVAAQELRLMAPYTRVVGSDRRLGDLDEVLVARSIALLEAVGASDHLTNRVTPDDLVAWELTTRPDQR
jgi:NitT/TauT family transport system substrate-binding protein